MKTIALFFLLQLSLFSAQLHWTNEYNKALEDAQREHKPIYLLIVSDTCKWCRKFENLIMQNKQIKVRVNKEFVTVLLSRDTDVIPKGLKTSPVPRHYFLDERGDILYSSLGYRKAGTFNSFMDYAQEEYYNERLKDENNETSTNN